VRGNVKDVDTSDPALILHDLGVPIMLTGLLLRVHAVTSLTLKPLPEMDIKAPGLAEEGASVILGEGARTVNVAEAKSEAKLPVAVTV
jgi:hypothetical protein